MKTCLVLINSRIKRYAQIKEQVEDLTKRFPNIEFFVKSTILAGDTFRWAYEFSNRGGQYIITCGGDGTINEAFNGAFMARTSDQVKFGHHACGSANDFKRTLPKRPLNEILELLFAEELISTRGAFLTRNGFKRWFVNESTLGMGALVCRDVELRRHILSPNLNFLIHSTFRLVSFNKPFVRVEIDGKEVFEGTLHLLVVGKGMFVGNGLGMTPQADYLKPNFGVTIISNANALQMLKFRGKLTKAEMIDHPNINYFSGKSIKIEVLKGRLPIETDGEYYDILTAGEKVEYGISSSEFSMVS